MGRRSETNTSTKKNEFIEFEEHSEINDASGRCWLPGYETGASRIYGLSLTLNGLTIKGCSLFISKSGAYDPFIKFPEYEKKDKTKDSIIFFTDKNDIDFMKGLAAGIGLKLPK